MSQVQLLLRFGIVMSLGLDRSCKHCESCESVAICAQAKHLEQWRMFSNTRKRRWASGVLDHGGKRPTVRVSPRWTSAIARLPGYSVAQHVSFPFAGIGGPERAFLEAGWPFRPVNVVEKRVEGCNALKVLHGSDVPINKDINTMSMGEFGPVKASSAPRLVLPSAC